jgi:hypothetical protein
MIFGHASADRFVPAEADPSRSVAFLRRRLAQVVEQHRENQGHRNATWKKREHQARMGEYIALRMKFRRLFATFQGRNFRQDLQHQPARVEQIETAHAVGRLKDFHQLVTNPFGADLVDGGRAFANGPPGRVFDFEIQDGREA